MKRLFLSLLLISAISMADLNVPNDYPTIQEAVNSCASGDTIIVSNGTYNEGNIEFPENKAITLASEFRFFL
ncbi:MAG: hypothetical protein CR982_04710 [Candidatus Cloacimonadota bacterium]|nr:MAG: hypothetical protein CR982_04710 [Candidatus Cloacimonadota bacterium]PIE81749.1 MAG: hypothetical protein CSA15_00335 [Candidatus Delongbacteria bacterium]